MTSYLLDTNIVSEIRKPKPHGGVLTWMNTLRREQIFVVAVTFGELQRGIEQTRARDRTKAEEIEAWVAHLPDSAQVLVMDVPCFREWARLMQGKQNHLFQDAMIAATARVYGLTVATRNEKDFAQLGVPIFNPFRTP